MNSTVSALESLDISYQYISFSPKQKMLLEQTAKAVDGDAALSGRFHKDGLSLRMQDDCSEPRDPLSDNTHPAYQLSPTERGLYPALLLLSATQSLAEAYRLRDIPRQVLVDTLSDIPLWMNNCETHFGYQGMLEFPWLSNHMRMRLFRLGRLEYIYAKSRVPAYFYRAADEKELFVFLQEDLRVDSQGELNPDGMPVSFSDDGKNILGYRVDSLGSINIHAWKMERNGLTQVLRPGDPVLDVHIPEGPPLSPNEIASSLHAAPAFFRKYCGATDAKAFTCGSWLMAPGLAQIIPKSNIAQFQQLFFRVPYTTRDNQVLERVFGKECRDWSQRARHTQLQKGLFAWYQSGKHLRQMQGVILLDQGGME